MMSRISPFRSIKQRMMIYFTVLSLLSACLTTGFSHYFYSKAVNEEFVMITSEATGRLNHHMEFYFQQMKNSTRTLLNTRLVQNWLVGPSSTTLDDITGLEKEMNNYVSFNFREINNMYLISNDRRVYTLNNTNVPTDETIMERWHKSAGKVVLTPTHRLGENGPLVMDMVIPVYSNHTTKMIGKLVIQFSLSELDAAFDKSRLGQSGTFFLISDEDIVVNHPNKEWVGKPRYETLLSGLELNKGVGTYTQKWQDETYLVSQFPSGYTGWSIVCTVPYDEMSKGLHSAVFSTMLTLAILAACITFLIPYLVKQFVGPIKHMKARMELVSMGNLEVRAQDVSSIYEYKVLTHSFNNMVAQLDGLMREVSDYKVKEMQLQLRQSQATVRALQNQINPHLLYNTLDIIKSIAYLEEVPLIEKIAHNLADVYRYASKWSDQEVTLKDELDCLVKYLEIVHIRYPKKFESDVKVNAKFLACPMIKLSIQPIVENSVKYAVEAKGGNAAIIVSAYDERQDLIIEIADNGPGIPVDTLSELKKNFDNERTNGAAFKDESIGLANVHARLSLRFGNRYGVTAESFPGRGSVVSIRIPFTSSAADVNTPVEREGL
ncbi:sensor histidine kinase [Paenibacillus caseinilyticus]|uniref:histidine kinase n=1 Tax=Paenibacillus mucilaginosus K02 TaxID=997761 RepID=I0BFG2_9BACL|nr:histidine kinase [Paenibacillus mucilaginosus]AFH61109.1 histidine kinase [Paenibacillus mucilaginosus K02]